MAEQKDYTSKMGTSRDGDTVVYEGDVKKLYIRKYSTTLVTYDPLAPGDTHADFAELAFTDVEDLPTEKTAAQLDANWYTVVNGFKSKLSALANWILGRIKNLATTITAFRTGDVIPVDGPSGTAKMGKDDLLRVTAENALNSIHSLSDTATEAGLVSGNYFALDGSAGTKKLPCDCIAPKSEADRAVKKKASLITTPTPTAPYNDFNTFPSNEIIHYSGTGTTNISNRPSDANFQCTTIASADDYMKLQIACDTSGKIFMRQRSAGSWKPWILVKSEDDIVSSAVDAVISSHKVSAQKATALQLTSDTSTPPYNDLNTFPSNEFVLCVSEAVAGVSHKPSNNPFSVFTFSVLNGLGKIQMLTDYSGSTQSDIYIRQYTSGAWRSWKKIEGYSEMTASLMSEHNFVGRKTSLISTATPTAPYNDFNTFPSNEIIHYSGTGTTNISNRPSDANFQCTTIASADDYMKTQVVADTAGQIFVRQRSAGSWKPWVLLDNYGFVNPMAAFNNIVCFGDSLTWGWVQTGSNPGQSRQAYKPWPVILGKLCDANAEYYAQSGDTAKSNWERYNGDIVAKTNALAIIYLGTNGGLTDTLATDAPEDADPSTWADTNTGCYAKLVDKLKTLGYKVLLINISTESDNTGVTQSVIRQIGNRFSCAVCEFFKAIGVKYRSWPNGEGNNTIHYNDLGYAWFAYALCKEVSMLPNDNLKKIIPD